MNEQDGKPSKASDKGHADTGRPAAAPANPANIVVRAEWARLRLWQIQFVRDIAALFLVLGVLWLGYELSIVTVPLLLAIFLAYLLEPLVKRAVSNKKVSRQGVAAGFIGVVALGVVVPAIIGIAVAVVQGVGYVSEMAQNVTILVQSVEDSTDMQKRATVVARGPVWTRLRDYVVTQDVKYRQTVPPATHPVPPSHPPTPSGEGIPPTAHQADAGAEAARPLTNEESRAVAPGEQPSDLYVVLRRGLEWAKQNGEALSERALKSSGGIAGFIAGFATGTAGRLGALSFGAFLTAFFFFFICTGWGRVLAFWQSLIPERKQNRVFFLVGKMDEVIAGFVRGRITICGILMVYYTIVFWIIGVPAWLLMGPLMGALVLIPYAQILGYFVAVLLMALQPGVGFHGAWWWILGAPLVVVFLGQMMDDYILTPKIQGKSTNMDTPTILFASIAGGSLAGVYGLLVAIPVAACVKILLREVFWPRFKAWVEGRERDFLPLER